MKKIKFFDYNLDSGHLSDFTNNIFDESLLINNKSSTISFINPHSFVEAEKISIFKEALLDTKYLFIDGIGIKFFTKVSSKRIIGYDFFLSVLKFLNEKRKNKKVFFLGSKKKVLEQIKHRIQIEYPHINVCGLFQPSFVNLEFSDTEINKINNILHEDQPEIVFVGLTAPKQEILSYRLSKLYRGKIFINIGAVFDYYSRNKPMPNKFLRQIGLEWLFRLITDYNKIKLRIYSSSYLYLRTIYKKKIEYNKKLKTERFNIISNLNDLAVLDKKSILVAFNLAFLAYYSKNLIKHNENIVLWPDGITTKLFMKKISKIPGYKLIDYFDLKKFERVIVIGNLYSKDKDYLKKKHAKEIIFIQLPFFDQNNISALNLNMPTLNESDIVLVTLPTPKQEIIANLISKKYKKIFIICIGGGLSIASGRIRKCPRILDAIGLEFLWRLQEDTIRRIKRIVVSVFYAIGYLSSKKKKIKFQIFEA